MISLKYNTRVKTPVASALNGQNRKDSKSAYHKRSATVGAVKLWLSGCAEDIDIDASYGKSCELGWASVFYATKSNYTGIR